MKKIKTSKRGLCFVVDETDVFYPGQHFSYFVGDNKITIKADEDGKNTVSKKKSGKNTHPLFDIRSKKVKEKLAQADYLQISIIEDRIIISLCKKVKTVKNNVIRLSEVLSLKNIATYEMPAVAVGQQLTLFDFCDNWKSIDESHTKNLQQVFKVMSLFSGSGMLDYPFALDKDFQIVYACELDEGARKTYEYNIGSNHPFEKDIRQAAYEGSVDVVLGGPPCTPFSNANRTTTRLINHPAYFLVEDYIRMVKNAKTNVFVIENVPEFVTTAEGELYETIVNSLSEYEITCTKVIDYQVGGYTKRERCIIIGSKIGKIELPALHLATTKTVRDALEKVDATWFNYNDYSKSNTETQERMNYVRDGHNWEDIPPDKRTKGKMNNFYRRLCMDDIAPTIVNPRKTMLMPPKECHNSNRILSVAECSALSGFPKEFHFLGTLGQRQQQVANGVPFAIGNFIKKYVKKALQQTIPLCN